MPRLPDVTALGGRPTPRPVALPSPASAGAGVQEAARAMAVGSADKQPIQHMADTLQKIADLELGRDDSLESARLINGFRKTVGDEYLRWQTEGDPSNKASLQKFHDFIEMQAESAANNFSGSQEGLQALRVDLENYGFSFAHTASLKSAEAREGQLQVLLGERFTQLSGMVTREPGMFDAALLEGLGEIDKRSGGLTPAGEASARAMLASALVKAAIHPLLLRGKADEAEALLDQAMQAVPGANRDLLQNAYNQVDMVRNNALTQSVKGIPAAVFNEMWPEMTQEQRLEFMDALPSRETVFGMPRDMFNSLSPEKRERFLDANMGLTPKTINVPDALESISEYATGALKVGVEPSRIEATLMAMAAGSPQLLPGIQTIVDALPESLAGYNEQLGQADVAKRLPRIQAMVDAGVPRQLATVLGMGAGGSTFNVGPAGQMSPKEMAEMRSDILLLSDTQNTLNDVYGQIDEDTVGVWGFVGEELGGRLQQFRGARELANAIGGPLGLDEATVNKALAARNSFRFAIGQLAEFITQKGGRLSNQDREFVQTASGLLAVATTPEAARETVERLLSIAERMEKERTDLLMQGDILGTPQPGAQQPLAQSGDVGTYQVERLDDGTMVITRPDGSKTVVRPDGAGGE